MAEQPIKRADIIDDNIFTSLIKEADTVIAKENELIETNKKLLVSYREIANISIGNDSKSIQQVVETTKKADIAIKNLTDSELYLIEVEKAKKQLQQEEIKLTNALEKEQRKLAKALADASGEYKKGVADLRNLKNQLKDLEFTGKTGTKAYKDLKNEFTALDAKVRKAERSVGEFNRNVGNYPKALDAIGGKLAAAFSIGAVVNFGQKIFETRAEFQKFEAVLTNSLGSSAAAQKSLEQIQKIASKTPFSVRELTESYVKLVNRGFKPSTVEITKLGDLAASQGKQFDQLTEALLDAQTGEFERLKEFGIKAKTTGDTVALSFKGQTVEVNKFNETALRNAIIGFGELEGVAGGMAAISDTLGGKISNLGDNFDAFFNNLGKDSEGVFGFVLDQFNEFLSVANEAQTAIIKINDELKKGGGKQSFIDKYFGGQSVLLAVQVGLDNITNSTLSAAQKTEQYQKSLEIIEQQYKSGVISVNDYKNAVILVGQAVKGEKEATDAANEAKKESNKLTAEQIKKAQEFAKAEKDLQNQLIKLRIENTQLNQRREEDAAKNENRLALEQLAASKGTSETKAAIQVELEDKLRQDLISIRDKYAKEGVERKKKEEEEKLKIQQEADKKFTDAAQKQADDLQAIADKNKAKGLEKERKRKEQKAKELKDAADLSSKLLEGLAKELAERSRLKVEAFDREISDTEKNIEHQRRLAENGKANTLAFEEEQKRKNELLREQEKQKELKRQKAIAFFKMFSELVGQGKQPAAALGEAAATTYAADAIAGSFIKGTENVERDLKGSKVHNGTDGYVIAVDGKERILNPDQNNKVGALSNEELADLAYRHNNGLLDASLVKMSAYPQNDFAKNVQDSALLMQTMKLNENITDLKDIIKSRPVPSFKVDSLGNVIENIYQNGTTKIIKHINSKKRI